jgi:hypothetical protein
LEDFTFYSNFNNKNKNRWRTKESGFRKEKQNQSSLSIQQKYIYDTANTSLLQIKNYSDIQNIIIPFFNKYSILGVKSLDFNDFKLVANLIDNKEHLTSEGLNQIIEIVKGMNLDRKFENTVHPCT